MKTVKTLEVCAGEMLKILQQGEGQLHRWDLGFFSTQAQPADAGWDQSPQEPWIGTVVFQEMVQKNFLTPSGALEVRYRLSHLNSLLLESARTGNPTSCATWIAEGADVNHKDANGNSVLHWVTKVAHADDRMACAEVLLNKGANPNITSSGEVTPLHWAADEGLTDFCELLLKHGANINATTLQNSTPLHWAVFQDHLECTRFLLAHGADAKIQNKDGLNPMEAALKKGQKDMAGILRSHLEVKAAREAMDEIAQMVTDTKGPRP
jgi:ankyrin repeat protein